MAESNSEMEECRPTVVENEPCTSETKEEHGMAENKPMAAERNSTTEHDKPPPYSLYDMNNPTLTGVNVTFNNTELPPVAYVSTVSNTQSSQARAKRKCSRASWIFACLVIPVLLILCGVIVYITVTNSLSEKPATIPTTTRTVPTWPTTTKLPTVTFLTRETTTNKPWRTTTDKPPTVTTELVTRTSEDATDSATTTKTTPGGMWTTSTRPQFTTTDVAMPTLSPDVLEGECPEYGFPCLQGHCVSGDRYCDYLIDCPDESDEDFCEDIHDNECGVQSINPYSQNGDDVITARAGSWPWQASLHRQGHGHHCSAVLIDDEYVLTAAHCIYGYVKRNFKVVLGINEQSDHAGDPQKQESQIETWWIHPNYNPDVGAEYNIGLIKLRNEAEENDYVYPACLPREDQVLVNGQGSYVTNWFISKTSVSRSSDCDERLKQSYVKIVSENTCRPVSSGNTVCVEYCDAASLHSQHCKRDTGGPLLTWYGGSWKVTGIATSDWSCNHSSCLGSFENVATHAWWIENIIDDDD